MNYQTKFLIAALAFLIPVFTILFQSVLFYIGKFTWEHFFLKKLKRTSKIRIKIIEFKYRTDPDLIYVLTGVIVAWLFFAIIGLFL